MSIPSKLELAPAKLLQVEAFPKESQQMDVVYSIARRCRRVRAESPVRLVKRDSHSERRALSINLSVFGAQIQSDFELAAGEMITVLPWGNYGTAIPSRVVWVQRKSPDIFLAGLEFVTTY